MNISDQSEDNNRDDYILPSKADVLSRKYLLKGKVIAISISESDNLADFGYGIIHLKDAIIEIARYILALGGKLAYGGDMRQGGFTELIFELLAYYNNSDELPNERFFSFLAWPISLTLSDDKQANLSHVVSFVKLPLPEGIAHDALVFPSSDLPENSYLWARGLTDMRIVMEEKCDARVLIGGRMTGFRGKYPGLLEELLLSIQYNKPCYLAGAFGGITHAIIQALDGEWTDKWTNEYYLESPQFKQLFDSFNTRHNDNAIDYPNCFSILKEFGFSGLSATNGLNEEDNRRLAVTPHIHEIVYLILKGLTNKFCL